MLFIGLFICFVVAAGQHLPENGGESQTLNFDELRLVATANKTVGMDTISFVDIGLVYDGPSPNRPNYDVNLTFSLGNPDGTAFHISNASMFYTSQDIAQRVNKSVYVEGILLGVNSIEVYAQIIPHKNVATPLPGPLMMGREIPLGEVEVIVIQP